MSFSASGDEAFVHGQVGFWSVAHPDATTAQTASAEAR
jgi:hypothetical protein